MVVRARVQRAQARLSVRRKGDHPGDRLLTIGDPNDGITSFGFDELNRLTSIDYADTTPDVAFTYDANGNRLTMGDGAGNQSYLYDPLDRLTSVTRGSDVFSYLYDDAGNVTRRTYPGASSTTPTPTTASSVLQA